METPKETVLVYDSKGFRYEIVLKYFPHWGFGMAYYDGHIIADCQLNKVHQPLSDSDFYWEQYEQLFAEWRDEIKTNIISKCIEYFNKRL